MYIIDYGFAETFLTAAELHKEQNINESLDKDQINIIYESVNVQAGVNHSRRDDIESLLYTIVELAVGKLPWSSAK